MQTLTHSFAVSIAKKYLWINGYIWS